jgi:FKBP-type peptidyl-prolyl cis-trans isomerase 2
MIADGTSILLHYTLALKDGELIESNMDEEPLEYIMGSGELISGLETVLAGMDVGEELSGTLTPEQGFGLSRADAYLEIPREELPEEAQQEGALLQGRGPNDAAIEGVVVKLKSHCAVVDFNHPLAGKHLAYTLRLVEVR